MYTYVIGDIEDSERCFQEALECLRSLRYGDGVVFLGDIYSPEDSSRSIERISVILDMLKIPVHQFLDKACSASVIEEQLFNTIEWLRRSKYVSSYIANGKRVVSRSSDFKSIVDVSIIDSKTQRHPYRWTFLFGNKEMAFIQDIASMRTCELHDSQVTATFSYVDKKRIKYSSFTITIDELNILLTYLNECQHFHIEGDTFFVHNYINSRDFLSMLHCKCSRVISGHSRCYGRFFDADCPETDVYLLDTSHEPDNMIKAYAVLIDGAPYYFTTTGIVREMLGTRLPISHALSLSAERGRDLGIVELYQLIASRATFRSTARGDVCHYEQDECS